MPTARAELEPQLFPAVTGASSVYAMRSSFNWHNNHNYMVQLLLVALTSRLRGKREVLATSEECVR